MTSAGKPEFVDYYALLGVAPSSDISQIRRAYIIKAKEHHPDAGGTTEVMQQFNRAYKTLMSPTAKGAYDMMHSFRTGATKPSDYSYSDGRQVNDVDDMTDAEIDSFLDDLLKEYKTPVQKPKQSTKQRIKKLFEI